MPAKQPGEGPAPSAQVCCPANACSFLPHARSLCSRPFYRTLYILCLYCEPRPCCTLLTSLVPPKCMPHSAPPFPCCNHASAFPYPLSLQGGRRGSDVPASPRPGVASAPAYPYAGKSRTPLGLTADPRLKPRPGAPLSPEPVPANLKGHIENLIDALRAKSCEVANLKTRLDDVAAGSGTLSDGSPGKRLAGPAS